MSWLSKKVAPVASKVGKIALAPITVPTLAVAKAAGINTRPVDAKLGFSKGESALIKKYGVPAAEIGLGVAGGAFLASGGLAAAGAPAAAGGAPTSGGFLHGFRALFATAKNYLPLAASLARGANAPDAPAAPAAGNTNTSTPADGINPALDWQSYLPKTYGPTSTDALLPALTGAPAAAPAPIVISTGAPASAGGMGTPPWWLMALIVAVLGWFLTGGGKHSHAH